MSTCNRLDLQTLGSQPVIMPKNLPDHLWYSYIGALDGGIGLTLVHFINWAHVV